MDAGLASQVVQGEYQLVLHAVVEEISPEEAYITPEGQEAQVSIFSIQRR